MSNKKALIIGGAGFVGRNLTNYLIDFGNYEITVIDNFLSSNEFMVQNHPFIEVIHGDAGNINTFDVLTPDYDEVYLLHCLHGNQSSIYDPISDLDNSLKPTIATYEWLRRNNSTASIVYAGAGCAVAEKTWDKPIGVIESDLINLDHDSPYSISKLSGEMHSIFYAKQFDLNIKRARFQNVYGSGEYLAAGIWRGTQASIWRNVIPTFIWKAIHNLEIEVTGEHSSRDFIHVVDISRGLHKISSNGQHGQAYNLASGKEISIINLANSIIQKTNSKSKISLISKRKWDNSGRRFGSVEKAKEDLGFVASIDFEVGLIENINWMKSERLIIQDLINSMERNVKA